MGCSASFLLPKSTTAKPQNHETKQPLTTSVHATKIAVSPAAPRKPGKPIVISLPGEESPPPSAKATLPVPSVAKKKKGIVIQIEPETLQCDGDYCALPTLKAADLADYDDYDEDEDEFGESQSRIPQQPRDPQDPLVKKTGNAILDEFFPETILDGQHQPVSTSALAGKVLGFYFSGHWCAPCRAFTPLFVQWFTKFKRIHPCRDQLEIVFISSDRESSVFEIYHKEMAFHALPYSFQVAQAKLTAKFGVRGVPALIFVDAQGNLLSKAGKKIVTDDSEAAQFPWAPKTFTEKLGTTFRDSQGRRVTLDDLKGKHIGLYFSAKWCVVCKLFTPKLKQLYKRFQDEGKGFEIIFISSDHSQRACNDYFSDMPWLTFEDGQFKRYAELTDHFEIEGVPTLIVLDPELRVVTTEGRRALTSDPQGVGFPWVPQPFRALDDNSLALIDNFPFLLVITDGEPTHVNAAIAAIKPAADAELAKAEPKLRFFYNEYADEDMLTLLRKAAKIKPKDRLVILDMPTGRKYAAADQTVSAANVNAFVNSFLAGTILPSATFGSNGHSFN